MRILNVGFSARFDAIFHWHVFYSRAIIRFVCLSLLTLVMSTNFSKFSDASSAAVGACFLAVIRVDILTLIIVLIVVCWPIFFYPILNFFRLHPEVVKRFYPLIFSKFDASSAAVGARFLAVIRVNILTLIIV